MINKRVLIVEDDLADQQKIKRLLDLWSIEYDVIDSPLEACRKLKQGDYIFIILDLDLGTGVDDGIFLLSAMSRENLIRPTVIITRSADLVDIQALRGRYRFIKDIIHKRNLTSLLPVFSDIITEIFFSRHQIEDVVRLLKRFEHSMRRWCYEKEPRSKWNGAKPIRWYVDNEYHVQDILWVILSTLFEDLEDEENLPSLGQKHPRYDLGIPSLGLIIEVKYVREKGSFAKVIEEIAADSQLYLSKKEKYNKIIAFIYDDTCSIEQHQECKNGLLSIDSIIDAIIVSRPGKMPDENKRRELIKQLPE